MVTVEEELEQGHIDLKKTRISAIHADQSKVVSCVRE